MKRITMIIMVVMAIMTMVLLVVIEGVNNETMIGDPIQRATIQIARETGYKYAGVHHLKRTDDSSKLSEVFHEAIKNDVIPGKENYDSGVYVYVMNDDLDYEFGDNVWFFQVTKYPCKSTTEYEHVLAVVFED